MAESAGTRSTAALPPRRHRHPPVVVDDAAERRLLELGGGLIHSETRAVIRLLLYLAVTLICIPIQAVLLAAGSGAADRFPRYYHRVCLRIFGFRLVIKGRRSRVRPTLFVSNHISYLDITALGAAVFGSFVAKQEVSGWPLFGLLAKLQQTVFVRRARAEAGRQNDEIGRRLDAGDNLILFPEGTSSDGNRVLGFKSALFQVADRKVKEEPLLVQPVSVAYTRLNGVPIGRGLRPFFAWYGDMDLAPHLWHVAGLGKLTIVVEFHKPTSLSEFPSRKALANHCWEEISDGLARANSGR